MKVELISIGDELLIGQTINTNASWLGEKLSKAGADILRTVAISDKKEEIIASLDNINSNTDCIIITGGLGPTKDDITKYTLSAYFGSALKQDPHTLGKIEAFFAQRERPMLKSNYKQAELPIDCIILENDYGTAAGMWFEKNNKIYISLPGVPYEMQGIMEEQAIPMLKKHFKLESLYHKTALTQGLGESFLAEKIANWEAKVYSNNFSLAYLPSPGIVKLRISSTKGIGDENKINQLFIELENEIPEHFFGYDKDTLPSVIGKHLIDKNLTIGTVESCTSGLLASQISSIPGASSYYLGALLTYSYKLKSTLAKVPSVLIIKYGAVSEEVAIEMAKNGRVILGADICISTTGIAGPAGGTDTKPVGLVWIAIATKDGVITKKHQFSNNRERNLKMTVLSALNLLRIQLHK
ncbi:MAG: competence/damage-inducible protein A [Crocinitomicaceae bacterium]|jgi:nicotinamide-nucleotide amidase|tara:strand:+ start:10806 stop:12041 length:1236 start_codon:yes stop_codon:yes gene_type:complete